MDDTARDRPNPADSRPTHPEPEKPRSFADRLMRERGHLIHKLKAKDATGRWAYYFIYVPAEREAAFLKAIGGEGMIDLEDYGQVIASCYGEQPTEEVRRMLKDRYGFDV